MSAVVGECTICGANLVDGEEAYALTAGIMGGEGFCDSDSMPWEEVLCIECMECMDEVDTAFLEIRERLQLMRERKQS